MFPIEMHLEVRAKRFASIGATFFFLALRYSPNIYYFFDFFQIFGFLMFSERKTLLGVVREESKE